MSRPAKLRLVFPKEESTAYAKLLWDKAPETCTQISSLLPCEGESHHAIYSGSECVYLLDEMLRIEPENATANVVTGQIGFTWMDAGTSYGVEKSFAEICWFYDKDAQPRMWEGPVEVNIFATIIEPATDFYETCRRMRRERNKIIRIELCKE